MNDINKLLDELISPQEQKQLVSRAAASHAFQAAAHQVYTHPSPTTHRAYDEGLTEARMCGLTRAEIHQIVNEARKEALHGR